MAQYKILNYEVQLNPTIIKGSGGGYNCSSVGEIRCECENGWTFFIIFLSPKNPTETDIIFDITEETYCEPSVNHWVNPPQKKAQIYVPIEFLPYYVDLLRNEKPIYLYFTSLGVDKYLVRLTTGKEIVGEEEYKTSGVSSSRPSSATKTTRISRT